MLAFQLCLSLIRALGLENKGRASVLSAANISEPL